MKKYEAIENKYLYNLEEVERIVNLIKSDAYYDYRYLTKEDVSTLINAIDGFLNNVKIEEHKVIKETHETEEEAREYFGEDFINDFDNLLTSLDKQKTIVALHGTTVDTCSQICETGLQYKVPSLTSTAVLQSMAYEQHDMHYDDYEGLLNWKHRDYKGLVIVAVPYECLYKEGLWNHFQDTDTAAYGGQDYRIDSDFIVGYIDVNNKELVINPKYSRQHNYEGYEYDNEIFVEQKQMNNETIQKSFIDSEKLLKSSSTNEYVPVHTVKNEDVDISRVPLFIEELLGTFNSIRNGFSNGVMPEDFYKHLLGELSMNLSAIKKSIPFLKTEAQVEQEKQEMSATFSQPSMQLQYIDNDFDLEYDFDWEENVELENISETKSSRGM